MGDDKKWGGPRDGAGRPPSGRKTRRYNLNDQEEELMRTIAEVLRTDDGFAVVKKLVDKLK